MVPFTQIGWRQPVLGKLAFCLREAHRENARRSFVLIISDYKISSRVCFILIVSPTLGVGETETQKLSRWRGDR
jgi:hypothetical protein